MRTIITTLCLVFIVFLLFLSAADEPDSANINSHSIKGSEMSNLQDSKQKGTGAIPPIDTLKPARIETATFALG
jgi:hypothetical protein